MRSKKSLKKQYRKERAHEKTWNRVLRIIVKQLSMRDVTEIQRKAAHLLIKTIEFPRKIFPLLAEIESKGKATEEDLRKICDLLEKK